MFSQVKNPEPALLPTLNAALAALEKTGGKIVCSLAGTLLKHKIYKHRDRFLISSALPTWGPGRLFLRDDGKQHGGDAEKKLFNTEHPGWRKVAEKMVAAGVGVDFFLAAPGGGYLDIATIGKPRVVDIGPISNSAKATFQRPLVERPFTTRILCLHATARNLQRKYCTPSQERPGIRPC